MFKQEIGEFGEHPLRLAGKLRFQGLPNMKCQSAVIPRLTVVDQD